MKREYYSDSITTFLNTKPEETLGRLVKSSNFDVGQNQRDAWLEEISILHEVLSCHQGTVYFEYSIPRMGKRIDAVLLIGPVIFVIGTAGTILRRRNVKATSRMLIAFF